MADAKCLRNLIQSAEKESRSAWNEFRMGQDGIDLTVADLSSRCLAGFNLAAANLSGARLFNADLTAVNLSHASLTYADLRRVNLASADLSGANLSGSNLEGANLVDTNLEGAELPGARLNGVHLAGANLNDANLENVNFPRANLKFASFHGARLAGANVEEADLRHVDLNRETIRVLVNYDKAITESIRTGPSKEETRRRGLAEEQGYDYLFTETDHYKVLGLEPGASMKSLLTAYRQRVKDVADRVAHLGEKLQYVAQREFQRVQLAYRSLTAHLSKPIANIDLPKGMALSHKDPRDLSIEDYIEMIKWSPNNGVLHYNLGVRYVECGLVELAINAYTKALELNPKNEYAQHNLKLAKLLKTVQG